MSTKRTALVTGSSGAIGAAICKRLQSAGCMVCGLDKVVGDASVLEGFIEADLFQFTSDDQYRADVIGLVESWLDGSALDVLVNNAAYQHVDVVHPIPPGEWVRSYSVNVVAPYLLTTHLLDVFAKGSASVVNIGSIHSRLTKPGFVAYANTKAALASMTRGLALDLGDRLRINCIEPASVETPMLLEGFREFPDKRRELENYHPQKRIAAPDEIAELVVMISSPGVRFLHGACIDISGGMSGRLHDPV